MKEIEEDTKKWKNMPCSWTGRTNSVKMSILHGAMYTFNVIPIKIPHFSQSQNYLKIFMEPQQTPKSQSNLEKEKQSWRQHDSRLQARSQSYSQKDSTVLAKKNRYMGQWKRIENPGMDPQLIFDQAGKNIQWKNESLFKNGVGKSGQLHAEK